HRRGPPAPPVGGGPHRRAVGRRLRTPRRGRLFAPPPAGPPVLQSRRGGRTSELVTSSPTYDDMNWSMEAAVLPGPGRSPGRRGGRRRPTTGDTRRRSVVSLRCADPTIQLRQTATRAAQEGAGGGQARASGRALGGQCVGRDVRPR